jgi:hypothetical protein
MTLNGNEETHLYVKNVMKMLGISRHSSNFEE